MEGKEEQFIQSRPRKKVFVQKCAFLRVVTDERGAEMLTCLLKKGDLCDRRDAYPLGEACDKAVKKTNTKRLQDRYWASVVKHNKKKNISFDSAYKHKTTARDEYRFCKRKDRYPTEAKANEIRRKCEKMRNVKLRVLYCPYCKGWHLTHKYGGNKGLFD